MDEAKFLEFEIDLPFYQAVVEVPRIMGNPLYHLHNQVGSRDWLVRESQGRVIVGVRDPQMATFIRLKL